MTGPIENEAAYFAAAARNIQVNAIVGRIQRLAETEPEVWRLLEVVNADIYRRRVDEYHRNLKKAAERELQGGESLNDWHEYNQLPTPQSTALIRTAETSARIEASWIYRLPADQVRDFDFPQSLIIGYLKFGKLSDKQREWVTKLADELPQRAELRAQERKAQAELDAASEYVGKVGERIELEGEIIFTTTVGQDSMYGPRELVKIRDTDGNVITTFTTAEWAWSAKRGQLVSGKATVKEHSTYEGTKQTIVNRPKFTVTNKEG